MSTPCSFRRATLQDVEGILALVESAYRGDSSRQGWTTEADMIAGQRTDLEEITELMTSPGSYFLLMERQATLIANVLLSAHGKHAYLGMFAVRPNEQASGIGRAVLAQAEYVARTELGVSSMEMTVIAQRSELLAWYGRRGYVVTGEERPFPYGNLRAGLPLRDDLRFLVLRKPLTE